MGSIDELSKRSNTLAANADTTDNDLHKKCIALARNLWWTWHPEAGNIFRDLDPIRWRQLDHNPIALLREYSAERLDARATELVLHSRINHAYRRLRDYLASRPQWSVTNAGVLGTKPVAYFSAEFGIHESVPIYSGGLGVLSGDHIKSASGLGVPLVGVGLFYDHGYFNQHLDDNGYQREAYLETDVESLPIEPALSATGEPVTVSIETRKGTLRAKVWLMRVGRVPLYLLDCDVEGNSPEDRQLTSRLYGGDERTRIRQELVLGVGGVRALDAVGVTPGVYHLNEAHSAFAPLEVIRQRMTRDGLKFDDALREVARRTIFTTHTPVAAGHDRFDGGAIEEHLGPLRDELGISFQQVMGLGRTEPQSSEEEFCMTVVGLKLSRRANAVSALHGDISRRMWAHLWPWRVEDEVPIGHITNGVHVPTWLSWQMSQLFDRLLPSDWQQRMGEAEVWRNISNVDPGELWETHNALKKQLLAFARRRLSRQCRRRNECEENVESARSMFDPNVLTIGFGRRFATYKRAGLIFSDQQRLTDLLNDADRPIQLLFSGKAHPKDEPGKKLIQQIANSSRDDRLASKVVFLEDYDINVARHMVQGVDVWLNNPRRPLEAAGTSGQKAVLNGALNLSVLDGWWAEAFDGENGFAIGNGHCHVSDEITDQRDAESLYNVLEQQVVPMYYERDVDDLPRRWIQRMTNSIATLAWRFSAHRMLMDYTRECYIPAAGGLSCEIR